jgi:protocatechuate 3,4-dioxygenase beta subunit
MPEGVPFIMNTSTRPGLALLLVGVILGSTLLVGVGPVAAQPQATITAGTPTPEALDRGDTFTIEYQLTNSGSEAASSGGFQLTLPDGIEAVSASGDGTPALGNNAVFYVSGLDSGETKRTTVTFSVTENASPGDVAVSAVGSVGDNINTVTSTATVSIVTGEVLDSDGDPAAQDTIAVVEKGSPASDPTVVETDSTGAYSVPIVADAPQDIQYYQVPNASVDGDTDADRFPTDGSPDIYALGRVTTPGELGTTTLPEAYPVQVTVTDEDGTPVENASVSVTHYNPSDESSAGWERQNGTNANGLYEEPNSDGSGLELTGDITVVVTPPTGETEFVDRRYIQNVTVSEPTTLTFELETQSTNRFDTDGDGSIEFGEVLTAIAAFNDGQDIGGAPVGFQEILDVIAAFNQGG